MQSLIALKLGLHHDDILRIQFKIQGLVNSRDLPYPSDLKLYNFYAFDTPFDQTCICPFSGIEIQDQVRGLT